MEKAPAGCAFASREKENIAPIGRFSPLLAFYFIAVHIGALLYLAGGLPLFLWGLCTRLTLLYHSTWLVNSAAHAWGYRRFADAKGANNWLVALLAFGEGWHNNHHAWPSSARHGLRLWEIDISWWLIAALRRLHLARGVAVCRLDRSRNGRLVRG